MSFANGSDLILKVINAANPVKVAAANAKLKARSENNIASGSFHTLFSKRAEQNVAIGTSTHDIIAGVLQSANKERLMAANAALGGDMVQPRLEAVVPQTAMVTADNGTSGIDTKSKVNNKNFEALMLRNFVEDVLPKASSGLYGDGTAGDIWRSLEADFISQDMAKAGGIGIADALNSRSVQTSAGHPKKIYSFSSQNNQSPGVDFVADRSWPYFKMQSA
jgi:peptidoglycan hydrolase FlgJ